MLFFKAATRSEQHIFGTGPKLIIVTLALDKNYQFNKLYFISFQPLIA